MELRLPRPLRRSWSALAPVVFALAFSGVLTSCRGFVTVLGESPAVSSISKISNPFISTWRTLVQSESVSLPLPPGYTYDFEVKWGDGHRGTVKSAIDPEATHVYDQPGTYTVTIEGTMEAFSMITSTDPKGNPIISPTATQLIEVVDLGDVGWRSLNGAFAGCTNLTSVAGGVTTNVTDMSYLFYDTPSLITVDASTWDVSQAAGSSNVFDQLPNGFSLTCSQATLFGQTCTQSQGGGGGGGGATCPDPATPSPFISVWRTTGNNESITLPLPAAYTYNFTVDWGDGTTGTVTAANSPAATHVYATPGDHTVTINGTMEAFSMRANWEVRTKLIAVNALGNVGWKNLADAFTGCFNLTTFAGGETSQVTDMSGMFAGTSSLTSMNLSCINSSSVTNMSGMFAGAGAPSLTQPDLSSLETGSVTDMHRMFANEHQIVLENPVNVTFCGMGSCWTNSYSNYSITSAPSFTAVDLSHFDTSSVTDMSEMFRGSLFNGIHLESFDTSNVTDMSRMFQSSLAQTIVFGPNFNTAQVTNMSWMFSGGYLTNLDLSGFNTSNVTDMSYMFAYSGLSGGLDVSALNTSSVTNMAGMFSAASNLIGIQFGGNFDTSNVTNMADMFNGASSLTTLSLDGFNTSQVTNMNSMFAGTLDLANADLSSFVTSNVTDMTGAFTNSALAGTDLTPMFPSPPTLSYAGAPLVFSPGFTVSQVLPTVSGVASGFDISPTLPSGLNFNYQTGAIYGTPSAVTQAADYTISVIGITGQTSSTTVSISVANPSLSLSYSGSVKRGEVAEITVSLSPAPISTQTLWLSLDTSGDPGLGTSGTDFWNRSQALNVAAGVSSVTFAVPIPRNGSTELGRAAQVLRVSASSYGNTYGSATGDFTIAAAPEALVPVSDLDIGNGACARDAAGKVLCWGWNNYGSTPVVVPGLSSVSQVSMGGWHACVLTASGSVNCWGYNNNGQLGNGTMINSLNTPVTPTGFSGPVAQVVAGWSHTCVRLTDGTVQCWGKGSEGQLGNGTLADSSSPVSVSGVSSAISIASNGHHTCALISDGTIKCWGKGDGGQLGVGYSNSGTALQVPGISTATRVEAGLWDTCAILSDGSVKCWGNFQATPSTKAGLSGVTDLSVGYLFACAVNGDTSVRCWGYNAHGQLGDGTFTDSTTPVVSVASGAQKVWTGGASSCAKVEHGLIKCWGSGSAGELANGRSGYVSGVPYKSNTPVIALKFGDADGIVQSSNTHSCISFPNLGNVYCWGTGTSGQLGDGASASSNGPVAVDMSGLIAGQANRVTVGGVHACAENSSQEIWCWGQGYGASPSRIGTIQDSRYLTQAGGSGRTCALTGTTGAEKTYCWKDSATPPVEIASMAGLSPQGYSIGATQTCAYFGSAPASNPSYDPVLCWPNSSY